MGPFKDDVTAKLMVLAPPPPLSPFVTYLVVPPPPYVTEPNGDKLFSWISFRKYNEKIINKHMEYVFTAQIPGKMSKEWQL